MKRFFFFLLFITILEGCDIAAKQSEIAKTKCEFQKDCEDKQICEAGYCIAENLKDSDIKFNFSVFPQNRETNKKYYHSLTTEPLDIITIKEYQNNSKKLEVEVSDRIILKGKILSQKNVDFKIRAVKDDGLQFIKSSYMSIENGEEYRFYHINLPKYGNYRVHIEANSDYEPFFIDINNIENDKTLDIDIEKELNDRKLLNKKIIGEIKYNFNNEEKSLNDFIVYAYLFKDNQEQIISSKYISSGVRGNFSIKMDKKIKSFFIKIKSLDENYKNIETNHFIEDSGEDNIDLQKINIGTFSEKFPVTINITGNCMASKIELVSKTKIKVKGNLNNITKYISTIEECQNGENKECGNTYKGLIQDTIVYNLELQSGSYNLDVITHPESCYVSKFSNIDVDENHKDFYIELKEKLPIRGNIFAIDNENVDGTITFTRKDGSHIFKILAQIVEGKYKINLEPGVYDIFIKPNKKLNSNWVFLNQSINLFNYERDIDFFIPEAILVKLHLFTINNKALSSAVIKLNILPKMDYECNYKLPLKNYPLYQTVTDSSGSFVVPIPIITCSEK